MDLIYQIHNLRASYRTINRIEDLTEIKSVFETNTKNREKAVFEKVV